MFFSINTHEENIHHIQNNDSILRVFSVAHLLYAYIEKSAPSPTAAFWRYIAD